jgi:phosphomannomutase
MADHLCQRFNLPVYETKVGFKYVGEKMKETGAILGGEESGGSAISGYIYVRDAQLMNLYVLDLMVTLKRPLSKILEIVKKEAGGGYEFKREDLHFEYETYDKVKNIKTAEITKNPPKEVLGKKVVRIRTDDGLKLYFEDDSWLLIRFSGTEPVLRLYAEAKTMDEVEKLIDYAKEFFGK